MCSSKTSLRSYATFLLAQPELRSYAICMSSIVSSIRAAATDAAFFPAIPCDGMSFVKLPVRMTPWCRERLQSTPHIGCALHNAIARRVAGQWCPAHLYAWVKPLMEWLGNHQLSSEVKFCESAVLPTGVADLVVTGAEGATTIVEVKSSFREDIFVGRLHTCQLGAYASHASSAYNQPTDQIRAVLAYAHVRSGFWACYVWHSAASIAREAEFHLRAA